VVTHWTTRTLTWVSAGALLNAKQATVTNRSFAPVFPHDVMPQTQSTKRKDDTSTVSVAPAGRPSPANVTRYVGCHIIVEPGGTGQTLR
jgi:hypothetical protein